MTSMRAGDRWSRARCAASLGFLVLIAPAGLAVHPGRALAQSLIPGPSDPDYDAALDQLADAYDRQIHGLLTTEYGLTLTALVSDPAHRTMIDDFIASGERDFQAQSGHHPYEVIDQYGEQGDLGMFGGVAAGGDAFRYAVLRDEGAPAAQVDEARTALLEAMDGLHWQMEVTGTPGVLARGIERITPAAGDPPLPDAVPTTTPLHDAMGNPLPTVKDGVWRDDASGHLPFLIWLDDCSKDQLDGWVYAIGAVYDVVAHDPTIPADKIAALVADAHALGQQLMTRHEVAPGHTLNLVIMDGDGRPTSFHDLNAAELSPGVVLPRETNSNGFNALMALGIVRTLFHITGDEDLGRFYYHDLIGQRDYLGSVDQSVELMYAGTKTNFSNVNMAFVAAYGALRYESDQDVGMRLRQALTDHLYAPGKDRQAKGLGQAFFDEIYAAFQAGPRSLGQTAMHQGLTNLGEFPAPPYWNPEVDNCDDGEIAAGSCTAIDGTTTITLDPMTGHNDVVVATEPLPEHLRPPTNFRWRDDPYEVNGGGGDWLNPGGGFHAAYWMGRFLKDPATPFDNVSPIAVPPPPGSLVLDAGASSDAGANADAGVGADGGTGSGGSTGCGCSVPGRTGHRENVPLAMLVLGLVAVVTRRGRRRP